MNFSTTYFMIAFVMAITSTFGSAADVTPVRNLRGLDAIPTEEMGAANIAEPDMTIIDEGMYHRDMEVFNAGNGDRALEPDISCYAKWCKGKVRGTCYIVYPKCYPL
jgi:hypothetical protein